MTPDQSAALLLALAREELALVAADRWEELDDLSARRAAAMGALPRPAPAHLHDILREAMATQAAVTEALMRARDAARSELAGEDRRRAGAAAYRAAVQF